METNQIHRAEQTETNSPARRSSNASFPVTTFSWLVACLLIFLGVAFELGMLGFGPYNSTGVWFITVIGRSAWVMVANLAAPELGGLAKIWPLALVSLGSAILLIARGWNRFNSMTASSSGRKQNHAN